MARLVVVDRDGTLNVERHYLSDPALVELLPNVASGLSLLRDMGFSVAVVTNQSALSRGFINRETLDVIHGRLRDLLKAQGATVDAIYFCPHLPEAGCLCRKPQIGLLEQAARDFGATPQETFVIGDQSSDIEMGRRAGATTFLVQTGYGATTLEQGKITPDYVVADVLGAAQVIQKLLSPTQPAALHRG